MARMDELWADSLVPARICRRCHFYDCSSDLCRVDDDVEDYLIGRLNRHAHSAVLRDSRQISAKTHRRKHHQANGVSYNVRNHEC